MNEERDNFRGENFSEAVKRFKSSLRSGRATYFDVSEFEGIVEQLMEEGDLKSSEIAAKQGIQIHPNAIPLQLKYAQILINQGKYNKAHEYLDVIEKIESRNPDIYLARGTAWLITGRDYEATVAFKKALKFSDNEKDDILHHIGTTYARIGELPRAIYYWEKAYKENPKSDHVIYDLAFFLDQLGDTEQSIDYYNRFLDIDTFNYMAWFNLGTVYNKLNNTEKAIEAFEYSLAIKDDFHVALFNIGNSLANDERFEEAIEKYQEFLDAEPESEDAHCYVAECYLNLEDYEKADGFYRKALELNENSDTAWFGLGLLKWIDKKLLESVSFITKATDLDADNAEYWLTLGKVNNDATLHMHAAKALKQAARLDANHTEVWLLWSETMAKIGELQTAIRILKIAVEKNEDSKLKYQLVAFLHQNKKRKEAHEWLRSAMLQDFGNINYLFDIYPKAVTSKQLRKVIDDFRHNGNNSLR